ncbi:MAG: peroxiredoxin [Hyphomicrobiales bacterium]|nr:peroxiredoxin [Hyphomicrobiales bacterium]
MFRGPNATQRIFEIIEFALEQGRPLTDAEIFALRRRRRNDCATVIAKGDALPDAVFLTMTSRGPQHISVADVFEQKTVALFAVPGAFNPVSHYSHLPGFLDAAPELKRAGVDTIACTSVNDVFVLDEWAAVSSARDHVLFLADGNADFAAAVGMLFNARSLAMGTRSVRYAMLVRNRVVDILHIEPDSREAEFSSAATLLQVMASHQA